MAKSKDKKAKAAKNTKAAKPTKLPKEIGGVTISRALREEGGLLVDLMKHPVIASLAAAGITALTEAMREGTKPASADPAIAAAKPARTTIDLGQGAAILGTMIAARAMESAKGKR